MTKYFLDTFALVEIIQGNEKYKYYLDKELHTSIYNLYELYYNLLREFDSETAKKYFLQFKPFLIHFTDSEIFQASKFKLSHKKKKLSYADCLGYAIAQKENMKFLTGDMQFKDIENVEFVPR